MLYFIKTKGRNAAKPGYSLPRNYNVRPFPRWPKCLLRRRRRTRPIITCSNAISAVIFLQILFYVKRKVFLLSTDLFFFKLQCNSTCSIHILLTFKRSQTACELYIETELCYFFHSILGNGTVVVVLTLAQMLLKCSKRIL